MPEAARRICRDCTKLALPGSSHCDAHQEDNREIRFLRQRNAQRRESGLKKFYDSKHWRKYTVPVILLNDPLCRIAVSAKGVRLQLKSITSSALKSGLRITAAILLHFMIAKTFAAPAMPITAERQLWKTPANGSSQKGGVPLISRNRRVADRVSGPHARLPFSIFEVRSGEYATNRGTAARKCSWHSARIHSWTRSRRSASANRAFVQRNLQRSRIADVCARLESRQRPGVSSIWRGNEGRGGVCKICWRRAKAGKDGVPARDAAT